MQKIHLVRVTFQCTGVVPVLAESPYDAMRWAMNSPEVKQEIFDEGEQRHIEAEISEDSPMNPEHDPYDATSD